jgi:hypothetical protein
MYAGVGGSDLEGLVEDRLAAVSDVLDVGVRDSGGWAERHADGVLGKGAQGYRTRHCQQATRQHQITPLL